MDREDVVWDLSLFEERQEVLQEERIDQKIL